MAGTGSSVSRTIEATVAFGDERVTFQSVPARHSAPPAPPSRLRIVLDVHLVSHTHWDREWYLPVERFRQRLVALVDELIDDPPEAEDSFLLDGQAIVLDDYVRVRPDRARAIGELLRERRLEAGPWYVLADELIPSGEALVRNLLAGRRTLARFGASAPPVLYCPDSFGHPAALPSIAAGFGLGVVVLWRGYGSRRFPPGDTAWWTAPGGERVLLYHLSRSGYELASNLPVDAAGAEARWAAMRDQLAPRSTTGVVLLPHGADHHARQVEYRAAVNAVAAAGARDAVHRSSLLRFQRALVERASKAALPSVDGELRDSYGYTWTLQGTFATRAHEKRLNALAERALIRDAEPWNALASRDMRSRRALLDEAWRTLLEAHPHDTLCGCSIDDVAAAMELRLGSAVNQAAGVREDAVLDLVGYDAAVARTKKEEWQASGAHSKSGAKAADRRRRRGNRRVHRRRSSRPRLGAGRDRRGDGIASAHSINCRARCSSGTRPRDTARARRITAALSGQRPRVRDSRRGVGRRRAGVRNRLAADRSPRARGRRTDGPRDHDASLDAKHVARRQRRSRWHCDARASEYRPSRRVAHSVRG